MSRAKNQGTAVESAAVSWFAQNGFPETERRVLHGSTDLGDLRIRRDPVIIVECKRAMGQGGVKLTPWMRETVTETVNARAAYGILAAKQRGAGSKKVARWFSAMTYDSFMDLATHGGRYRFDQTFVGRIGPDLVEVSPVKVNSEYVPTLTSRENRSRNLAWHPSGFRAVPFAVTYTPGNREQRFVCGPLEQFVELLRRAGYAEDGGL